MPRGKNRRMAEGSSAPSCVSADPQHDKSVSTTDGGYSVVENIQVGFLIYLPQKLILQGNARSCLTRTRPAVSAHEDVAPSIDLLQWW